MKKIFLFIGLSILSFNIFAEGVPSVSVNKSQGGWTAILNLYNYVTFTPAELTDNGIAQLNCQGSGYSWCRVPNCSTMPASNGVSRIDVTEQAKVNMLANAINQILEQIENDDNANATAISTHRVDNTRKTYTKKLAIKSSENRGRVNCDSYVVKAVRNNNPRIGGETIDIFVDKVNLF